MKRYAIIVNVGSGKDATQDKVDLIKNAFADHGLVPDIFLAHDASAIISSTTTAITQGYKIIVAAGGDGTINAVAHQLLFSDSVLGVLPMGTFNHFAKDVGIPLDIHRAVAVLLQGNERVVDVGQVNDKIFLNNSSIGMYARMVRYREEQQSRGLSKITALLKAIKNIFLRYHFLDVEVSAQGKTARYRTPFLFVGNNHYDIEGLSLGSRNNITSGKLFAYIIKRIDRFALLELAFHALQKNIYRHMDIDILESTQLTIHCRKKYLKVAIDGEVVTCAVPLQYKSIAKALTVIC